ncbi:hypothetical protein BKA82DRAFT_4153999 [Pisolithus tinctorius]|nr:hypothetical protein BKA82DRAFT_4153999 [Pisolithus tinctorius]
MVIVILTLLPSWFGVRFAVALDGVWVTYDHNSSPDDALLLLNLFSGILFQSVTTGPQPGVHGRSPWVGPYTVAEQPLVLAVVRSALGSLGLRILSSSSVSPRPPPCLALETPSRGACPPSSSSPIVFSIVLGPSVALLRG